MTEHQGRNIFLSKPGMICSLGSSAEDVTKNLLLPHENYFSYTDRFSPGTVLPLGMVTDALPDLGHLDSVWRSRNNQLLLAAFEQIREHFMMLVQKTAKHRIGIIIGSSTSGILEGEEAMQALQRSGELPQDYHYGQQEIGAPAQFLAAYLDLHGPAQTISTACSSGAKALASARRLIEIGVCDVVLCGGVDSLCRLTVNGFIALDSVSDSPCTPFKAQRKGINIGEGACLFIMGRETGEIALCGVGETSDAYHISAPDPQANGARRAMLNALRMAKLEPEDIDYINLHGTATLQNDSMESLAVHEVFGLNTKCSSTKALTGHTLGAAGALEAGFCWLTLNQTQDRVLLPPQAGEGDIDPELAQIALVNKNEIFNAPLRYALSNSFAFGGNNVALVLGKISC